MTTAHERAVREPTRLDRLQHLLERLTDHTRLARGTVVVRQLGHDVPPEPLRRPAVDAMLVADSVFVGSPSLLMRAYEMTGIRSRAPVMRSSEG
jgi:hypothetical protein